MILIFFFRVYGVFYLFTNTTAPYAVKDAECSPGSATGVIYTQLILIVVACVFGLVVTVLSLVAGVFWYRGRQPQFESGLLVENEEQANRVDEDDELVIGVKTDSGCLTSVKNDTNHGDDELAIG